MATILVMDDEAPVRTLIRTALESVEHEVMEAANGHDGLALYRRGRRIWLLQTFSCPS